MTIAYQPRGNSVAQQVINFLRDNPEEQLDADLISAKCDCDRRNVHTLLGPAVRAGLLTRTEDMQSGELVYRLGQDGTPVAEAPVVTGFHGWLERKGQASAEGRAPRKSLPPPSPPAEPAPAAKPPIKRSAPFWIDTSTVQIDKSVPLPGRAKTIDWLPLLDKLDVGDSFQLPYAAKSSIGTAMKAFKDATGKALAARKVDGGIRVWRLS